MIFRVLLLVSISISLLTAADYHTGELWKLANQYYEIKDYDSAAKLYRDILSQKPNYQEARYNLAHAYYQIYLTNRKKGFLALAIYSYEQLLETGLPTTSFQKTNSSTFNIFKAAEDNLQIIRSSQTLKNIPREIFPRLLAGIHYYQDYLFHGIGILFIITVISSSWIFFNKKASKKSSSKSNSGIILQSSVTNKAENGDKWLQLAKRIFPLSLGAYLFLGMIILLETETVKTALIYPRGIVNRDTPLRKTPRRSAVPFSPLQEGETLMIKKTDQSVLDEKWILVKTPSGVEGWVEAKTIWVINEKSLPLPEE